MQPSKRFRRFVVRKPAKREQPCSATRRCPRTDFLARPSKDGADGGVIAAAKISLSPRISHCSRLDWTRTKTVYVQHDDPYMPYAARRVSAPNIAFLSRDHVRYDTVTGPPSGWQAAPVPGLAKSTYTDRGVPSATGRGTTGDIRKTAAGAFGDRLYNRVRCPVSIISNRPASPSGRVHRTIHAVTTVLVSRHAVAQTAETRRRNGIH